MSTIDSTRHKINLNVLYMMAVLPCPNPYLYFKIRPLCSELRIYTSIFMYY